MRREISTKRRVLFSVALAILAVATFTELQLDADTFFLTSSWTTQPKETIPAPSPSSPRFRFQPLYGPQPSGSGSYDGPVGPTSAPEPATNNRNGGDPTPAPVDSETNNHYGGGQPQPQNQTPIFTMVARVVIATKDQLLLLSLGEVLMAMV